MVEVSLMMMLFRKLTKELNIKTVCLFEKTL